MTYRFYPFLFALTLLPFLLLTPARAQERAAFDVLDAAERWAAPLAPFQRPAPARTLAPFAVTAYQADTYDEDAWLTLETATRDFDTQGRLAEITATTIGLFTGVPVQVRTIYEYGANGLIATRTSFEDPTLMDDFQPVARSLYTYDGTLTTSITVEVVQGDAFVPTRRTRYTYNGDRSERTVQETYVDGAFVPERRTTFTYGSPDFPLVTVNERYVEGAWTNTNRDTISEEGPNVVALTEDWDGGAWVNAERDLYEDVSFADIEAYAATVEPDPTSGSSTFYGSLVLLYANFNPDDFVTFYTVIVAQEWSGGGWVNQDRTTVQRDAGLVTALLEETWDGAAWVNETRTAFSYNAADRVERWNEENWDGAAWTIDTRQTFTYGADGNTERLFVEDRDFFTGAFVPSARFFYTWNDLAVATENDTPAAPFALALDGPNPFADRTALSFSLAEGTEATVTVYDVLGRVVATLADGALAAGEHRVVLDGRAIPAGTYVVRLTTSHQTSTQTVTVVH